MLTTRAAVVADFGTIAAIMDSSYEPYAGEASVLERRRTDLGRPPFTWGDDASLSWWLALHDGRPQAFAMWRHEGRNVHLHCLFVAGNAQRRGVGSALMRFHIERAATENPSVGSFTLHVRREARWARAFYAKHGYVERDPRSVALDDPSGLGDRVRSYERLGWPDEGKLLLHRPMNPRDGS